MGNIAVGTHIRIVKTRYIWKTRIKTCRKVKQHLETMLELCLGTYLTVYGRVWDAFNTGFNTNQYDLKKQS